MPPAARQAGTAGPALPAPARAPAPLRALSAGAGILGGEGLAAYFRPALGAALAAADIIVPLAITVILTTAILRGSDQTCERVFRLLRWIANRPEPPPPPHAAAGTDHGRVDVTARQEAGPRGGKPPQAV